MHTYSRPIYVLRDGARFRVKCYRGWVNAPAEYLFDSYAEARAFALRKLRTKYYARSCVMDETQLATAPAPDHPGAASAHR